MKIGAEVLRRSCIVGKARQHCREYQRQHEREPRRAGSLNINFILTWIKQNVRVALVDALGALHPQGLRGERGWPAPNNCHVQSDGGCSPRQRRFLRLHEASLRSDPPLTLFQSTPSPSAQVVHTRESRSTIRCRRCRRRSSGL